MGIRRFRERIKRLKEDAVPKGYTGKNKASLCILERENKVSETISWGDRRDPEVLGTELTQTAWSQIGQLSINCPKSRSKPVKG